MGEKRRRILIRSSLFTSEKPNAIWLGLFSGLCMIRTNSNASGNLQQYDSYRFLSQDKGTGHHAQPNSIHVCVVFAIDVIGFAIWPLNSAVYTTTLRRRRKKQCLHRLIPTDWLTDALFVSNTSRSKVKSIALDIDRWDTFATDGQNGLCIFIFGIYIDHSSWPWASEITETPRSQLSWILFLLASQPTSPPVQMMHVPHTHTHHIQSRSCATVATKTKITYSVAEGSTI